MAPATQKQDDDLLIISDDEQSDSGEIEFSIDIDSAETPSDAPTAPIEKVEQEEQSTEQVSDALEEITILDEAETEVVEMQEGNSAMESDIQVDEATIKREDALSIDLGSFSVEDSTQTEVAKEESNTQEKITAEVDTKDEGFAFDMDVSSGSTASKNETPQATSTHESMNDILDSTITKLSARSEVISGDTSQKESQISELNAQIKELQDQVIELEAEIAADETEKVKIEQNIAELESMKLDPMKEHNAVRSKK